MCDTSFATENFTGTTKRIFAKNSDREPNEAQEILHVPRMTHPPNTQLKVTYITIPQIQNTYEVFLSKPFQMWGAEMGVNEFGVCIGNEAVFTNLKKQKSNDGLTGMDLIRLALERAKSAEGAVEIITTLLEKYGQDANGGYENKNFFYHNSFIIADGKSAFVLETADRYWALKKIDSYYAISNGLTIDSDFTQISKNLVPFLENQKQKDQAQSFSFRETFSDKFYTRMSHCQSRRTNNETNAFNQKRLNNIYTIKDAMHVIRSHHTKEEDFKPDAGNMSSLCLHATGPFTPNDTTGSLIVEWDTDPSAVLPFVVYYSGTSNPCLSLFKPFYFGTTSLTNHKLLSPNSKSDTSLWWNQRRIIKRANCDYTTTKQILKETIGNFEEATIERAVTLNTLKDKDEFQKERLESHYKLQNQIIQALEERKVSTTKWTSPLFSIYWKIQNAKAGI